jgi:hypothetical protein
LVTVPVHRRSRPWRPRRRAQGYLKLPNGRTLTGHSHDCKRNGTTTLFAAYEVATGKVVAKHEKRRRRKELLAFMDDVVAAYPERRLEVIHQRRVEGLRSSWPLE